MNPLFEMLTGMQQNSQNSVPAQLAKQFGIQQEQAKKAVEALMPAFSQGLQRNASTPQGFAAFMQALANGNHTDYVKNPMKAFTPQGMQEGNAILGHLFGNKEVSRAVAKQAEAASGLSQTLLKQILPALAPMVMGGLFKQMMTPQPAAQQASMNNAFGQNAFGGAGGGILGQILEQMMKAGQQSGSQKTPGSRNPLEEMLEQMTKGGFGGGFGGGTSQSGSNQQTSNPGGGGPLGDIFGEMFKNSPMGGNTQPNPQPQSRPQSRPTPSDDPYANEPSYQPADETPPEQGNQSPFPPMGGGLDQIFGDLFKPSKQASPEYEKGIESIFDQFLGKR